RHVALRQLAEQTNVHFENNFNCTASLAVDGYTKCNLIDGSTSQTDNDTNPSWNLTLDTPKVVNRFVIYSR
ncbi:cell death abnormality protein 1, partial [Biomphalaria pfeifferi]